MEINTEINLLDKFIIALTALCEIKYSEGRVCEEFETCKHTSCQSSYNSWAIADKALRDINE